MGLINIFNNIRNEIKMNNSDDDDLELLSYLNTNKKLVKEITANQNQPPRKRIKISENLNSSELKKQKMNPTKINDLGLFSLFKVAKIDTHDDLIELILKELDSDNEISHINCYLYDSWISFDVEINDTVHLIADQE